ncbi:hypothetical protein BDN72DRAFT_928110 [Pluteus cervinus]|uniref:Uncharacterized protein n=1 Tax=Pluteus cervinus TaxID=181527 RepID=A0ACD3B4N3_9AGAR|nr:hypothetical protein BDN72DRAFT_928110 [Pluteus cervinus]
MEREDFPRVSLESITDWDRVRVNYQRAVVAQVDALVQQNHLGGEKEALMAHLLQYVDSALSMAQPNLRINGQRLDSYDNNGPNTEPFDEALDRHIWALAENRLKSQKQHAEDRRTVPGQTQANIAQIIEQAQLADAEAAITVEKLPDEEEHAQLGMMLLALLLRPLLMHLQKLGPHIAPWTKTSGISAPQQKS